MGLDIDFATAWQIKDKIFVDVRSQSEYALDHIPGAINIPVLDDDQRKETGTIYKQISPKEARRVALKRVAPKLPALVEEFEALAAKGKVVVYCWRGGQRSQSIQAILEQMRIPCQRIKGGYKEYRGAVNAGWQVEFPFKVAVLHGLTGIGKTRIIKELEKLNLQTLDLEGLAGNRGSAFGNVGLAPQPNQKAFESSLWQALQTFDTTRPIVVECESKRIGRLLLPDNLHLAMKSGIHILAYDTIPHRVEKIIEDYQPDLHKAEIIDAILRLKEKLGKTIVADMTDKITRGAKEDYQMVVEDLLVKYYDPLYTYPHGPSDEYDCSVDAADSLGSAKVIDNFLQSMPKQV